MYLAVSLLALGLCQDTEAAQAQEKVTAEAVVAQVQKAGDSIERPQSRTDRQAMSEYGRKRMEAIQTAAKQALADHRDLFDSGEGLYYKGQLLTLMRDQEGALAAYIAHAEARPDTTLAQDSLVAAASLARYYGQGPDQALALFEKIDVDRVGDTSKRAYTALEKWAESQRLRSGLNGHPVPSFDITRVLNGPADLAIDKLAGKVVLMDFWATWCGPCRAVIPELVKMQEEHGDAIQVLGMTRFYGYGSDFSGPDAKPPHGGKPVGSRDDHMSEEQEIEVNEAFAKAFELNYPIVFTGPKVAHDLFGVQGIPTVFVLDKAGNVIGHVVGSGEKSHAELVRLVASALGEGAGAADASLQHGKK